MFSGNGLPKTFSSLTASLCSFFISLTSSSITSDIGDIVSSFLSSAIGSFLSSVCTIS